MGVNWNGRLGGTKNQFNHKNWYLVGYMGAISYYVCGTSTKNADMVSGRGIDDKSKHYQNHLMWVMFLAKIHCWRVVIIVNFGSNLFQRLRQIFD